METLTFLVKSIDDPTKLDFEMLQNAFRELDLNSTGTLSLTSVKSALQSVKLSPGEIEAIFQNIDLNHDGEINYSEFLAVTVDRRKALVQSNLRFAFHHFDTDNSGYITSVNLKECFKREGKHLSDEEIDMMVAEVNP